MISLSERWKVNLPRARVGFLYLSDVANPTTHPAVTAASQKLVEELRDRYQGLDRPALRELPVFAAYDSFYRQFRKTYHVQLQLESVIFKNQTIRSPSALVSCMFMAELQTGLLTAGHDFDALELPLKADVAAGGEHYLRMDGSEQQLKAGDLLIRDQQGILSSVIYGPDHRTRIDSNVDRVVFTTYGPPGISGDQIEEQLMVLEDYVHLIAPGAVRNELIVL